ncbi:MAG: hypothetical protein IPO27_03475 [Bacteroidetes bacterium]|nr:hypothetical protein [Bacteroidota bacterium]
MSLEKENDEIARTYGFLDRDGKPINIPPGGSIGLLAVGFRGLMAWRAKRIAFEKNKSSKKS